MKKLNEFKWMFFLIVLSIVLYACPNTNKTEKNKSKIVDDKSSMEKASQEKEGEEDKDYRDYDYGGDKTADPSKDTGKDGSSGDHDPDK